MHSQLETRPSNADIDNDSIKQNALFPRTSLFPVVCLMEDLYLEIVSFLIYLVYGLLRSVPHHLTLKVLHNQEIDFFKRHLRRSCTGEMAKIFWNSHLGFTLLNFPGGYLKLALNQLIPSNSSAKHFVGENTES